MTELGDKLAALAIFKGMDVRGLEPLAERFQWLSVPGGWTIFDEDEAGDVMFAVVSGRLGVFKRNVEGSSDLIAQIGPGETVGEMALLADEPRSATIVALRDSELIGLDKQTFDSIAERSPAVMRAITRLVVTRLRNMLGRSPVDDAPRTVALLALSPDIPAGALTRSLARELCRLSRNVVVLDRRDRRRGAEFFSAVERDRDMVLYQADCEDKQWTRLCLRQADRVVVVAGEPDERSSEFEALISARPSRTVDLAIYHQAGRTPRSTTAELLRRFNPHVHCHVRENNRTDLARLARLLVGRAVGIVFSGGGARGFAHIGVLQALRDADIPIDLCCGTSIGAITATAAALEWPIDECQERCHKAFVQTNPLSDYTIPMVAISRGRKASRLLREHLGETLIEDAWRPLMCTSSDLTSGEVRVHKTGPLWESLRASIAIPGVLTPVIQDNHILVDGGVLNNMPIDLLLGLRRGPIIAVDVMRRHNMTASLERLEERNIWSLMRNRGAVPNIFSLLARAATAGSHAQLRMLRSQVDLLIEPDVASIAMLDWSACDRAIEAGYRQTMEQLEKSAAARSLAQLSS